MYYLTFTAKNTKDRGRIQTFRAKVWRKPPGDIYELDFFEKFKIGEKPSKYLSIYPSILFCMRLSKFSSLIGVMFFHDW